jgi:hypothetical protein
MLLATKLIGDSIGGADPLSGVALDKRLALPCSPWGIGEAILKPPG